MGTGIAARLWDVVSCEKTANYLCEERAVGVAPPAHPVQVPVAACAEGWDGVSWTDSCFKVRLCLLQSRSVSASKYVCVYLHCEPEHGAAQWSMPWSPWY